MDRVEQCPPGHYQSERGQTECFECEPGFFSGPPGTVDCKACAPSLFSGRAARKCQLCAEGYYKKFEDPDPFGEFECEQCDEEVQGAKCPAGTEVSTLQLDRGHWRPSNRTTEILFCKTSGNHTPCNGGSEAGDQGDGYCLEDFYGPRCELCRQSDHYFNVDSAKCVPCGDVGAQLAVFFIAIFAVMFVGVSAFHVLTSRRYDRFWQVIAGRRAVNWVRAVWNSAGMQSKIKTTIGFAQCVAAVPFVYHVELPQGMEGLRFWYELMELPSKIGRDLWIDSSCLGSYMYRLLFASLWPVVVICVILGCCVVRAAWQGGRLTKLGVMHLSPTRRFAAALCASVGSARDGFPTALVITFVLLPGVSSRIFKTFLCDRYKWQDENEYIGQPELVVRYLAVDLRLSCDSPAYDGAFTAGILLSILWPLGVPLLYCILLWRSRKAIRMQTPTPSSTSINFLHADYEPHAFFWEPLDMLRKIFLTGAVLLIGDETVQNLRILLSLLISILFFALNLVIQPHRRAEDAGFTSMAQLILVRLLL